MREIVKVMRGVRATDGAGVRLNRVFGYRERGMLDPFLMMDHFGSDNPADYMAGFPWHPHRGIETVTYLLDGKVEHGDSMGNKGVIGPGDAQWMTAGSGIIHQEMPEPGADGKTMEGFQLWVNLPASLKMTEPRYRAILAGDVPTVKREGTRILVMAGSLDGVAGATPELFIPVRYLVVEMEPGAALELDLAGGHNAAAYVFRGKAEVAGKRLEPTDLGIFGPDGADAKVAIHADAAAGARFLFISGKPLGEPIAWGGPIVMNTEKELQLAFEELDRGTFIKLKPKGI